MSTKLLGMMTMGERMIQMHKNVNKNKTKQKTKQVKHEEKQKLKQNITNRKRKLGNI